MSPGNAACVPGETREGGFWPTLRAEGCFRSSARGYPGRGVWCDAMEVVEAAAAQLETLKFGGIGFGGGQGEAAPSPDSVPASEPPPPPPSDKGAPDTGQDAEAQPAGEQAPELALSTAVGRPEPPPGGACVTGPGAADSLETSDSDSDRSGAYGSRSCWERARLTGGRSRGPRGPGREGRHLEEVPAHVLAE